MTLKSEPAPKYFEQAEHDWLLAISRALAEEVAVTRERMMTLEALLIAKGVLNTGEIDTYAPDDSEVQARIQWSEDFSARVFAVLEDALTSRKVTGC